MGSGGSKKKNNELTISKETIQINNEVKINKPIKMAEAKNKNDRVKECIIETSLPFEKLDFHLSDVSKSICKIRIEIKQEKIIGTGFLLKFDIDQELFYCLISNEHIIKNEIIKNNNNIIYIFYDNENKCVNIKLGNKKRYIKSLIHNELDITVVEILDEDNISKDYFLFPEFEYKINNKLINKLINNNIYIPQYVKGKELMNARGIIKDINKY